MKIKTGIKQGLEQFLLILKCAESNSRVLLDFLISFGFIVLIFVSVVFATYYVVHEFMELKSQMANSKLGDVDHHQYFVSDYQTSIDTHKIESYMDNRQGELSGRILKVAEHIFLCLLPCFTLLGFFTYYRLRSSYYLRDVESGDANNIEGAKEMKLAKTLFVSNLISYVLIKVIEEISESGCDIKKLIAYGGVLVILFIYYFFLDFHKASMEK